MIRTMAVSICIMLSSTIFILAILEIGLAAFGFIPEWRYCTGWAMDNLDWRYNPKPGYHGDVFGSNIQINSIGTRGPEPVHPEVLAVGDSCTFGVALTEEQPFSAILSARGIETINAGVPGYNSYLGLRRLQGSSLLTHSPKLITIYFGWNDHWRAIMPERSFAFLRYIAQYSRLASKLLAVTQRSMFSKDPQWRFIRRSAQVPIGQFKNNLKEMIASARRINSDVVLITPPWEPRLAEKDKGFFEAHSFDELMDHPQYIEAVREVATETKVKLLDMDLEIKKRTTDNKWEYFNDFVHLNAKGHLLLAELLEPFVETARVRRGQQRPLI